MEAAQTLFFSGDFAKTFSLGWLLMMKPFQISSKPHRKWRWGTLLIHLPLLTLEFGNEPYPFILISG
jgi:hypothetical protein